MSQLKLLPERLRALSISPREIVLPFDAALEAIDHLQSHGVHILGWEGWVKDTAGRVGHGTAPQGSASLDMLSIQQAAQLCRDTILAEAAQWAKDNAGTTDELHFCLTVRA